MMAQPGLRELNRPYTVSAHGCLGPLYTATEVAGRRKERPVQLRQGAGAVVTVWILVDRGRQQAAGS